MKWLIRIAAVVIVLGGIGFVFRDELMLEAVGIAMRLRTSVGPHQEIDWERGPSAAGRTRSTAQCRAKTLRDTPEPGDDYIYWPN